MGPKDNRETQPVDNYLKNTPYRYLIRHSFTILILEKLTRPSSVKFGVPSSMNARSVRYMPR